jgi:hypothetical protein
MPRAPRERVPAIRLDPLRGIVVRPTLPLRATPSLTYGQLTTLTSSVLADSIDSGTYRGYERAVQDWAGFCSLYGFALRPTLVTLCHYIAYTHSRGVGSIKQLLSGLAFFFSPLFSEWHALRRHPLVHRMLAGADRRRGLSVSRKPPLRLTHLSDFVATAAASYDSLLAAVLFIAGFFGLHRLGELTVTSAASFDWKKVILRSSVSTTDSTFSYLLPYHKADRLYRGSEIILHRAFCPSLDILFLLSSYLRARDLLFGFHPFLFVTRAGQLPTRRWALARLRAVCGPTFAGHSLRSGGATFLAEAGVPDAHIQALGRWSSSSFQLYIRNHPALMIALHLQPRPTPALQQ